MPEPETRDDAPEDTDEPELPFPPGTMLAPGYVGDRHRHDPNPGPNPNRPKVLKIVAGLASAE